MGYTIKLNSDVSLTRLKARLITKGYSQMYNMNYQDTFSPDVKLTSVRILIFLAVTCHWPLQQLNIKNAFLNTILDEEVYIEQLPGFVARGSRKVCMLKSLYMD